MTYFEKRLRELYAAMPTEEGVRLRKPRASARAVVERAIARWDDEDRARKARAAANRLDRVWAGRS